MIALHRDKDAKQRDNRSINGEPNSAVADLLSSAQNAEKKPGDTHADTQNGKERNKQRPHFSIAFL